MDILAVIACLFIVCKQSLVLCDEVHSNNGSDWYVSYQGIGDLVLACNGSDGINITGFDLTNHATSCPHQTCALSENDILFIENCNDNSTCTIPVHNMSGCITEKGFYNVKYSCKSKALTCDFDHNRCNISKIQGAWTVNNASKVGRDYRDHTLHQEYGRFMYIINGQSGETKITNRVYSSPKQCLTFYYWGNDFGYLTVFRELKNGSIDNVDQFPNANNTWKIFTRNLNNIGDYYLRFKATGSGSSQFLVDDIRILNADCDESRDHIQYNQTCRTVDDVTELQGCSKYYTENVISHLDPMKETCHHLYDDGHICNVSSDPIHCDTRQLVEEFPFCFNLNTLTIKYTCTEKIKVPVGAIEQNKDDATDIGLVAGSVSGVVIVCLIFVVLLIICRRRSNTENGRKRKDPALSSDASGSGNLPSKRPQNPTSVVGPNAASNNPLYGQSLATKSKQSNNKPSYYPEEAGVYENIQHVYALASGVNQYHDDDYGESVAGIYDISGNNRHKVNDPIYSYDHSVDDTYDTSYQGRRDNPKNDTYSHMFGKQTEGDYEIAGS